MVEHDELLGWSSTQAGLAANAVDPVHQLLVEGQVLAHRVVDAIAPFQQAGQDLVDVTDRKSIISTKITDGTFLAGAQAVPEFLFRIALATEQDVFAVLAAGDQHQYRFRLVKTGQVIEVAVGPVGIVDAVVAVAYR